MINQEADFFTTIATRSTMEGSAWLNITYNAAAAGLPDLMPKIKNGPVIILQ